MTSNSSLDPSDWEAFRALAHRMVDDAVDHMRDAREGPTWQPMPEEAKAAFRQPVPTEPTDLAAVYAIYQSSIEPYPTGNTHPRFFGYVHGSGTPVGALADFLAATLNSNVGGREHAAVYVERQVIAWFRELASFQPVRRASSQREPRSPTCSPAWSPALPRVSAAHPTHHSSPISRVRRTCRFARASSRAASTKQHCALRTRMRTTGSTRSAYARRSPRIERSERCHF